MDDEEQAYYRAVEDHFAALRGTPFLFSPKDFTLLRRWWQEGVPLAAVLAGMGEVFERRRERDEDPVSSLSYCRHAVVRHAKRLAAAHVGGAATAAPLDVAAALRSLAGELVRVRGTWRDAPAVVTALLDLEQAIATLPSGSDPAVLDETLAELEFTTLDALLAGLPAHSRDEVAAQVARELKGLAMTEEARERMRRALTAKAVRRLVGLPRMELHAGAA